MQDKRISDCWNVDGDRTLSDSWTEFTKFTLLNEETSSRIYVVREETNRDPSNNQTRFIWWPENWIGISKAAMKKEESDNARKLRGIYFIDAEDGEKTEFD